MNDQDDFEPMDPMSDMAANGVSARLGTRADGSTATFLVLAGTPRFTQKQDEAVADLQRQALLAQEARVKGNMLGAHDCLDQVDALVVKAHEVGVPWEIIGWSTGVSALVAQKCWGSPRQ